MQLHLLSLAIFLIVLRATVSPMSLTMQYQPNCQLTTSGVTNRSISNKLNIKVYWLNMKAVKDTMNISMTNCISSVLINCRHVPTGHLIDSLFCPSPENWTANSSEETSSGRRNQIKDIVWKSKLIINTRTCVGYRKYFEINTELWSFKSLWYCRIVF